MSNPLEYAISSATFKALRNFAQNLGKELKEKRSDMLYSTEAETTLLLMDLLVELADREIAKQEEVPLEGEGQCFWPNYLP